MTKFTFLHYTLTVCTSLLLTVSAADISYPIDGIHFTKDISTFLNLNTFYYLRRSKLHIVSELTQDMFTPTTPYVRAITSNTYTDNVYPSYLVTYARVNYFDTISVSCTTCGWTTDLDFQKMVSAGFDTPDGNTYAARSFDGIFCVAQYTSPTQEYRGRSYYVSSIGSLHYSRESSFIDKSSSAPEINGEYFYRTTHCPSCGKFSLQFYYYNHYPAEVKSDVVEFNNCTFDDIPGWL